MYRVLSYTSTAEGLILVTVIEKPKVRGAASLTKRLQLRSRAIALDIMMIIA
jgi:hypothetical protein